MTFWANVNTGEITTNPHKVQEWLDDGYTVELWSYDYGLNRLERLKEDITK